MYSSPGNDYRNLLSLFLGIIIIGGRTRRYNRNTTITNSELTQIGDSPIALWGYTQGDDPLQPAGTGIDGSKGLQPRGVDITRNLCHEYGERSSLSVASSSAEAYCTLFAPFISLTEASCCQATTRSRARACSLPSQCS